MTLQRVVAVSPHLRLTPIRVGAHFVDDTADAHTKVEGKAKVAPLQQHDTARQRLVGHVDPPNQFRVGKFVVKQHLFGLFPDTAWFGWAGLFVGQVGGVGVHAPLARLDEIFALVQFKVEGGIAQRLQARVVLLPMIQVAGLVAAEVLPRHPMGHHMHFVYGFPFAHLHHPLTEVDPHACLADACKG